MSTEDNTAPKKLSFYERTERLVPIFEILEKSSIIIPFVFLCFGGIFQIISLSNIDPSYIRFFSISQLVSDSLVFIFRFISIIFPIILGYQIVRMPLALASHLEVKYWIPVVKRKIRGNFRWQKRFLYYLSKIIYFCIIILFIYFFYSIIFTNQNSIKLVALGGFLHILVRAITYFDIDDILDTSGGILAKFFQILIYLFLTISLYIILSSVSFRNKIKKEFENVLKSYSLNNINTDRIHNFYTSKGFKDSLLYSNDQFIFIQLKDSTNKKTKIEVLKFDKFFEDEDKQK